MERECVHFENEKKNRNAADRLCASAVVGRYNVLVTLLSSTRLYCGKFVE